MEFNKLNFKKNNFFAIDSEEKNNGNVRPEDNFKKSEKIFLKLLMRIICHMMIVCRKKK